MCIVGSWSFPCTCNSSFDLSLHSPPRMGQKQNMTKTFFFLSFGAGASVGVSVFFSAAAGAAASGAGAACFCRTRQGGDQYVRMRAWYHASMRVCTRVCMQIWQAILQPLFDQWRLPSCLACTYLFLFRLGSVGSGCVSLLLSSWRGRSSVGCRRRL